jgi:Rieske Fe-S protein
VTSIASSLLQSVLSDEASGDRLKGLLDSPENVPQGEGKIVSVNGKKIAAYRDQTGTLHQVSAVCTHLGCVVAWNAAEKSWDCPCHGGRFSYEGEVLHGPPVSNLEKHQ